MVQVLPFFLYPQQILFVVSLGHIPGILHIFLSQAQAKHQPQGRVNQKMGISHPFYFTNFNSSTKHQNFVLIGMCKNKLLIQICYWKI